MWQVFLMYALFGSIFSVGKIGLEASQPYFLTGMRMLLAGGLILAYLYAKDRNSLSLPQKYWTTLFWAAVFNVFITNAFEFWGLQYMSAGKTCLIYSLSPFAAAFIGYFTGTERLSPRKWLGLCVGIVAFLPMMLAPWFQQEPGKDQALELLAEGALLISAFTCVIGWILVKKLTVEENISHPLVNGYSFVAAGILCMLTSVACESWDPVPITQGMDFLWTLCYIVVVHNLICYSIYAASLRRFSVTFMAFAGLSNPIFAGLFGWSFLGEDIGFSFVIAMLGVAVGLYLYYIEEVKTAEV